MKSERQGIKPPPFFCNEPTLLLDMIASWTPARGQPGADTMMEYSQYSPQASDRLVYAEEATRKTTKSLAQLTSRREA